MANKINILSVIVSYNSLQWIEKNIRSVFVHTLENELKVDVMLVDNGSTDETLEMVKQKFPDVKIVETGQNLGFAKANNIAFEYALKNNYDYVFLVNHDGWLLPDFWENVVPALKNNTDYGLLSPFHYDATEKEYDFGFKKYLPENLTNQNPTEVKSITGAFLLISKKCLEAVKGFDPIFFFYGEDIDLCLRAKRKGFKIGLIKDAKAVHDRKERPLDTIRLSNHFYANYLVQIKENNGLFLVVFLKALLSNIFLSFKKRVHFKNISTLYYRNIFRLLKNYRAIKSSYNTYR